MHNIMKTKPAKLADAILKLKIEELAKIETKDILDIVDIIDNINNKNNDLAKEYIYSSIAYKFLGGVKH